MRSTPPIENAATRTWQRQADAFNRQDLEGFLDLIGFNGRNEDRRKGFHDVVEGEARRIAARAMFQTAPRGRRMTVDPIAIRGRRLTLARERYRDADEADGSVAVEFLRIMEVGHDDLIRDTVTYDPDDIDSALDDLAARWIASGDVAHPDVVLFAQRLIKITNRHDWDTFTTLTAGATHVNHRQLGNPEAQTIYEHMPSIQTLTSLVPGCRVDPAELFQDSARGVVGLGVIRGTTTDGVAIEIPLIQLMIIEGDRATHIEDFDPDQRDLALARFAELTGEDQPK